MLFTSYSFIGFVLLLALVYYLAPGRHQWKLLLLGSLLFYAFSGPWNLLYILTTSLTVWAGALAVEKNYAHKKEGLKELKKADLPADRKKAETAAFKKKQAADLKRIMVMTIVFNLLILAVVKYTNFLISNINGLLGEGRQLSLLSIALPMGISFYTLQAIGYLVDVHREVIPAEKNYFKFLLFISFFPLVIQGPICRFGEVTEGRLFAENRFSWKNVSFGLERILWGFFKKLVIADRISAAVNTVIGDTSTYRGAYILFLMLMYTIELYADFTGGIDITIGVAEMLGITLPENFKRPYFSQSLKEYWRRWHISMCEWFRNYLFYPVSTSKPIRELTKFSKARLGKDLGRRIPVYVSSFVVWFATGVWHGASWNFIVWGLLNWAVLMISEELEPLYARFHKRFPSASGPAYSVFCMIRTFLLVCFMNLFDCYAKIGEILSLLASVFTVHNYGAFFSGGVMELGMSGTDYVVTGIGILVLLAVSIYEERKGSVREMLLERPYLVRTLVWTGLFVAVLLIGAYGAGYDASQFIYNRF